MTKMSEYLFLLAFFVAMFSASLTTAMDVYTTSETATDDDFCPGDSMEFIENDEFLVSVLVSECLSHLQSGGPSTGSGLQLKGPFFSPDLPLSVTFNVTFWDDFCRLSPEVVECFRDAVRSCRHLPATAEILTKRAFSAIWRQISFFPEPIFEGWACDGPRTSDRLRAKYSAAEHLAQCCDAHCSYQVDQCISSWRQELEQVEDQIDNNNSLQLEPLARSTFWCVLTLLPPGECNAHHRSLFLFAVNQSMPFKLQSVIRTETVYTNSRELVHNIKTQTKPIAAETVGVYGSSHIITANANQHTTCKSAAGDVVLLKNYFIDVSVKTSQSPPVQHDTPRPINQLTVSFYDVGRKLVAEYRTDCHNLSNTFHDDKGNNVTTDDGESWSVEELVKNESVVIRSPVSGVLFVRCWRAHLSVVARLPTLLLQHSTGLLVAGCPAQSVANISDTLSEEHCLSECRFNVTDLFQQICVYECESSRSSQVVSLLRGVISDIESAAKADITSGLAQFHFNYTAGASSTDDWTEATTQKKRNGAAAAAASSVLIRAALPILLYMYQLGGNAPF